MTVWKKKRSGTSSSKDIIKKYTHKTTCREKLFSTDINKVVPRIYK